MRARLEEAGAAQRGLAQGGGQGVGQGPEAQVCLLPGIYYIILFHP